ncbi:MAG: guanylate kinase [Lachnospiraceae bacterium]
MNGKLIVLSGCSGVGKGTVVRRLLEKYPEYVLSISATTRRPREGEQEGVNYFYKTPEEFEQMIAGRELIEYAQYVGNYYGTPKAYVEDQLSQGRNVILEIEPQGALQIKQQYPQAMLIFINAPDLEELERRLNERGTETEEQIARRLARAQEEQRYIDDYDRQVVNGRDQLEQCVDEIHAIVCGAAVDAATL